MKTFFLCGCVAIGAGLASFGLTRWFGAAATPADEMIWLRQEFALTTDQSAAIERLHEQYGPVCTEHCARIMSVRQRVASLPAGEARAAAATELDQLLRVCTDSTRRHLEAVAALMSPAQGSRYLEMIGSKVAQHGHAQPFGLR